MTYSTATSASAEAIIATTAAKAVIAAPDIVALAKATPSLIAGPSTAHALLIAHLQAISTAVESTGGSLAHASAPTSGERSAAAEGIIDAEATAGARDATASGIVAVVVPAATETCVGADSAGVGAIAEGIVAAKTAAGATASALCNISLRQASYTKGNLRSYRCHRRVRKTWLRCVYPVCLRWIMYGTLKSQKFRHWKRCRCQANRTGGGGGVYKRTCDDTRHSGAGGQDNMPHGGASQYWLG